jgi:hypothetical protein
MRRLTLVALLLIAFFVIFAMIAVSNPTNSMMRVTATLSQIAMLLSISIGLGWQGEAKYYARAFAVTLWAMVNLDVSRGVLGRQLENYVSAKVFNAELLNLAASLILASIAGLLAHLLYVTSRLKQAQPD